MESKKNCNKEEADIMSWIRFPLVLGVVMAHSNIYALVEIWEGTAPMWPEWLKYIFNYSYLMILPESVPLLFIISGYFFFRSPEEKNIKFYLTKWHRRIYSLLVPYLIWNTIAIAFLFIRFNIMAGENLALCDYISGFWDFTGREGNDPADGPLWYIRDLMVMSLTTPLLYLLLRKKVTAILLFALLSTCYITGSGIHIAGFDTDSYIFFAVGAYIATSKINFANIPHKVGIATLILYVPMQILINKTGNTPLLFLVTTAVKTTALLYLVSVLLRKGIIGPHNRLSKISFTLYALHGIIIGGIIKTLYTVTDSDNPLALLSIYISTPLIIITISYTLQKMLNRYAPTIAKLMTGNR